MRIDATLAGPADGEAAQNTVARLREAVHAVPDADALVGGYTAQRYDTLRTAEHDRTLIVPVVLAIILVILMGLLRSLVMPVLLVATVALSFLATLGVSSWSSRTSSASPAPTRPYRCTASCSWWPSAWTTTSS